MLYGLAFGFKGQLHFARAIAHARDRGRAMRKMASTRLLFAGCGAIARHHLRALQASGRSWQVSAVVDPNRTAADNFVKELPHPDQCKVCYGVCYMY